MRPVDGAEAVVSHGYWTRATRPLKQAKRQVVTVGANDAQLDDVLRELRRGERARVAFDDKTLDDAADCRRPSARSRRGRAPGHR